MAIPSFPLVNLKGFGLPGLSDLPPVLDVEVTAKVRGRVFGYQVVAAELTGPFDEDTDGLPEFLVALDLPGEAFDVPPLPIELDPKAAMKALRGGFGAEELVEFLAEILGKYAVKAKELGFEVARLHPMVRRFLG